MWPTGTDFNFSGFASLGTTPFGAGHWIARQVNKIGWHFYRIDNSIRPTYPWLRSRSGIPATFSQPINTWGVPVCCTFPSHVNAKLFRTALVTLFPLVVRAVAHPKHFITFFQGLWRGFGVDEDVEGTLAHPENTIFGLEGTTKLYKSAEAGYAG